MVLALMLDHPNSMQIRNVVRHICDKVHWGEVYEVLGTCVFKQSETGELPKWSWAGTLEECQAARVPATCQPGCKCFNHIMEFRSRPDIERTFIVNQRLAELVSLPLALPEDNNMLMPQEWERLRYQHVLTDQDAPMTG